MREFSNFRVLVVDGDVDFARSLSNRLEIQKFIVETAVDAAGAGAALERFEADAALIEFRLGGGVSPSGLDLIADLRRRRPGIICVMVTAFAELKTVLEAWRAGADDLLTKPIDPPALFAVLEHCIARRKRLRESEQRFRDFSEATSDWFWEMDENLRFSYFSDRFSDVTGVPHDSLLGKTREETGVPDIDPKVWEAHLADLAAHRSFRDFQHWRTLTDGRQVCLSINGKAIFDEAGAFLGYRGAGRDITERKRAEDALRQAHDELEQRVEERTTELLAANTRLVQEIAERNRAEAELRESEAHYREIFDESPAGIWESDWSAVKRFIDHLADHGVTDWRGYFTENPERLGQAYNLIRLVDVSRAVLKLYGVADTTTLAKIYRADTVPQDNLDGFREALLSLIEGPMTSLYEARERRADGAEIITRNTLAVPVNSFDDWSRVIYSVEDITERKRAEDALRKSEARYREIYDESPVGIWEEDWTEVKRLLEDLVAGGVTDLRKYFNDNPDRLREAYDLAKIIDISRSTYEMYGAPDKQTLIDETRGALETSGEIDGFLDSMIVFMAGETDFEYQTADRKIDGTPIEISARLVIPPNSRHDWSRVIFAIEDITERKRVDKERRLSARRLEDIADAASDWFWELDTELRFSYVSDRYAEVAGLGNEHFIGRRLDEVYGRSVKLCPEVWKTYFDAVEARRDFRDFVHDDIRLDGIRRVISNTGKAIFDEDGVFQGYRGASTDITERRVAEDALRESDERVRLLLDSTAEAIYGIDLDGNCTFCNPACVKMLGYDRPEDILGKHVHDLIHHTRSDGSRYPADECRIYQAFRNNQGAHVADEVLWRADGSSFPAEYWSYPMERNGRVVGSVVTFLDITVRRAAEKELEDSQRRLLDAIESFPGGFILYDNQERLILCNSKYREFYPTIADLLKPGARLEDVARVSFEAGDVMGAAENVEAWMKLRLEQNRTALGTHEQQLKDGRWLLCSERKTLDGGTVGIRTDITAIKQVQAQLHQAQKMEAVGQLTGGIAHDFNNLLAIVMGNIELIEDEIEGNGALGGYLKAAFSAVDDAATLTQSLLAFSRNQPLMPKVADMNTLVRKMIGLVGHTLGEAIIIKTSFADDLAPVSIDSGQLQNALLNLVVNARDAMPDGGEIYIETGSLTVGGEGGESEPLAGPGDYVSLIVRDTGEGMARDVLEHVFEPFFTTKEVGEGSGLGLSMVFGFVKQSGGHVTIHSEVGRGTTVTLCLPTTSEAISDEKKPIRDLGAPGGGETILFVEDDERVLHIIADQLTGMGYKVHHARDGDTALDVVDKIPAIDLLLTDVKLRGGMNGAELALEMRRRLPSLPVLYASGHSAAELKKAGHLKDNADLIEKPFTRRELAAKVAAMLS